MATISWARGCAASTAPSCCRCGRVLPPARWCSARAPQRWRRLALARTTHRGPPAAEHPAAQHLFRSRRNGPSVPLTFAGKEKPIPSMALELASRAQQAEPVLAEDGSVTLAGYRIPSAVKNTLTLNFDGANDVQTYSLADLRACVERNDKDFFHRQFADKIVIFGTLLDSEDRKLTSKRFATGFDQANGAALRVAAGGREPGQVRPQHDCRRLYPCDRRQQSDRPRRAGRARPVPTILIAIGFAPVPRLRRDGLRRAPRRRSASRWSWSGPLRDARVCEDAGVAAERAVHRRPRAARR